MNANELAEVLEDVGMEQKHYDTIQKAATMLRQQQAEIEAFKKDNKELHAIAQRMAMAESDARKSLQWFKDAQEKQNEPVAWTSCVACGQKVKSDSIHTCSPQLKTLTDEEIKELAHQHRWNGVVEFARAILRKASEK